jgi:hypothetical protein
VELRTRAARATVAVQAAKKGDSMAVQDGNNLTVILENRPGTAAALGQATGKAGINLDGFCGFPCQGEGVIQILVEDAAGARDAIEQAGLEVRDERQVLVADIENRPGYFGEQMQRCADAGVNVDLVYATFDGRVVIGADDLERARELV